MKELARLLRYARPYWLALLASVLLMACAGAAQSMLPLLFGPVLTRVLQPSSADAPVQLFRIPWVNHTLYLDQFTPAWVHNVWSMVAGWILLAFLVKSVADYAGNLLINFVGLSAVTDLRQKVFDKVLKQGAEFFETHSTGRLMSSIMLDIEKIQLAVSQMLADWLRQSFSAVGFMVVLLLMDWKLALFSVVLLPTVLWPTVRLGKRIRRTTRRAQDAAAEVNQILHETISGHQVVASFGSEPHESRRFRKAARSLRSSNIKYIAQQAVASPLIELMGVLTIIGLVNYGRDQIKAGAMSSEDFIRFVVALLMLYEPVKRLTGIHNIFQQAIGASQKVFEYLAHADDIHDKPGAKKLAGFGKAITFEQVNFRYPTSPDGFLLHSINLEVKAGEIVAIVGPSGAGKTTLVNLVPRFYDVSMGAVLVDGRDVREVELASLRRLVGVVAQDTFLFNDTVANNIRYGSPGATDETVFAAARNALADEFILKLPQGYATIIGERGVKLSGGQRQRIAIARALLKNAPILILDEATSHLDTESEMLVQRALSNLMADRTVIVIAHRLSTVRRADKIVVVDKGRIVETGTHEELVNLGGVYQRLHELQFVEIGPLVDL
jgi:ATP-binding cassette, subfamily B, bacterial MsbA